MSTFQAIIYAIVRGFTEFLPVSSGAHMMFIPYVLGWQEPSAAFQGALSFGALFSLLVYFRHDWASTFAGFLGMIFGRKRPRTLDEWMMIFLFLSTLPVAIAWYYLSPQLEDIVWAPWLVSAILAGGSFLLFIGESLNRGNKSMFDWNWLDASFVGILQIGTLIPGLGRVLGSMGVGLMRNYTREALVKYAMFASAPVLAASAWLRLHELNFHAPVPTEGMSWLSFATGTLVAFLSGLLAIGGLLKQIERKSFKAYGIYRILLAAAITAFWYKNRNG
jgi:undecaprenyl-diphosphatase